MGHLLPSQHDAATRRRGSHARTRANIAEALHRDIPLRAGVIDVSSSDRIGRQRTHAARDELVALGVPHVGADHLRGTGRGANVSPDQLCGRCGHGAVAISSSGEVWPCVFARWISLGDILDTDLAAILSATTPVTSVSVGRSCWPQGGGSCAPNDPPSA